ncbi:hypothetical protein PFISCL1PPCAC_5882, partial [Pristionchus fissidentatus]
IFDVISTSDSFFSSLSTVLIQSPQRVSSHSRWEEYCLLLHYSIPRYKYLLCFLSANIDSIFSDLPLSSIDSCIR